MTRIVAIVLVRNEAHFVTSAIQSAIGFCDEMLVIDNRSTDETPALLRRLAATEPKIRLIVDDNASGTNRYVQPYIGDDVWVTGIDGDEIYDAEGLTRLRARILDGEFARDWSLEGHSLHALTVDFDAGTARGFITPAAESATRLYNFAAIRSWAPGEQRFHGFPVARDGYDLSRLVRFGDRGPWAGSDFRNLHMCFFPRSPADGAAEVRRNITDQRLRNIVRRPLFRGLEALGLRDGPLARYLRPRAHIKKLDRYVRGEIVTVALGGIGRPRDHAALDPAAEATEAMVAAISARRNAAPDLVVEALRAVER